MSGNQVGAAPNYQLAQSKAESLLSELGYTSPPISPVVIANHLGLTIVEAEMPENLKTIAGFLDMESKTIVINQADPTTRQAFTIAHEIGHYVMHKDFIEENPKEYKILYRDPLLNVKVPIEQEANCFAANLLVPMDILKQYEKFPDSALSVLFQVSQEVIAFRKRSQLWRQER